MTIGSDNPQQERGSKNEKGPEDMTAEELISKIYELMNQASDAFRHGRNEDEVERIDAETEKYSDAFTKLTGRTLSEYSNVGRNSLEVMNAEELGNQIATLEKELKSFKLDKTVNDYIEERIHVYSEAYKTLTGKEWESKTVDE